MLVAFLIMLREGIEAALIVGIVAGFLKQSGYSHMMPKVWIGVVAAALMSIVLLTLFNSILLLYLVVALGNIGFLYYLGKRAPQLFKRG